MDNTSASFRLRYEFYELGEYLIWAVVLAFTGAVLLGVSRKEREPPAPADSAETAWPPPPKRPS